VPEGTLAAAAAKDEKKPSTFLLLMACYRALKIQ
jgi:hypothetical protein